MTREEALNLALSKTNNIPDAINQANMLLAYVSGKYPEADSAYPAAPKKGEGIDGTIATLLGKFPIKIRWNEENTNILMRHINAGEKGALVHAAIEIGCSVKACAVQAYRRRESGPIPKAKYMWLVDDARDHLRALCGETGTLY